MTAPAPRFFWLFGFVVLALCAGYAALALSSSTWAEARAFDRIFPFYTWRIQPFSATAFADVRNALAGTSGLCAIAALAVGLHSRSRQEMRLLGTELRGAFAGLLAGLKQLEPAQRRLVGWIFLALTALRVYFSIANPGYDDAVSYEVFVSKGWLVTSSYYPIPNNHVFSNALSLLFYQISPGFWWSMRLPVLLISTLATAFLFAASVRRASYWVALPGTGLFSFLQLSLYHAGVGRGYWLLIGLAGVVFFAALELLASQGRQRAAWAGLVLAGTLGCYTIPTFLYVLASAFSWLGLGFIWHKRWQQFGRLVAAGGLIGMGAVLLYTPLLLVSGFDKFVGNGYVAALPPREFWRGLPAYVWHNEGFLAGQRTLGALVTLPVLAAVGWLFYLASVGRLPASLTLRLRRLGLPALWFVGFPYAVIVGQRVFPPERVMLYKAFFFLILAGFVVEWLLWHWPTPAHRWPRRALAVLTVLFVTYEAYSVVRVNPAARRTNAAYQAGLQWLTTQAPGPILIPEPTHNLFFRFYAHTQARHRPWQIDSEQAPRVRYQYVVAFPNKRGFFQPLFSFAPAYRNDEVEIYTVPKNYPLATAAWRH